MSIAYYQIQSILPQLSQEEIQRFIHLAAHAIGEELRLVSLEQYLENDFGLLYVASGGSENGFLQAFERLGDRPCYILTSGDSNSLAASMEILSYLQQHGGRGEILHGHAETVAARIRALRAASKAKRSIAGKRIGVIGAPSDWLIASGYDRDICTRRLQTTVQDISIEELMAEIERKTYHDDEWTALLRRCDYDATELEKALQVYGALSRMAERYELSAMTVRCFDLLTRVKATGCIGIAILNARGIYAGCEGDIPALNSMLILGELSGKPVFMCNPSRIDARAHTALFAHCTVPLNMPATFHLDTHFESKLGVAVAGQMPAEACTVCKVAGDLSRYYVADGLIVDSPAEETLCRTQITVEMQDLEYFLKRPIGNHHVVCAGNYVDAVHEFFATL